MPRKVNRKNYYEIPDFQTAIKTGLLPTYVNTWGPEHRAIIEQMYNQACFADNTGKIIVQEAPCGAGKSTLANGITKLSGVEKVLDMILMTDSNKRLADDTLTTSEHYGEWVNVSTDVAFLSDGNKVNAGEWKAITEAWLVTMSCQRFLMMSNDARTNAMSCYRFSRETKRYGRQYRKLLAIDEHFEDVSLKEWYYSDLLRYAGIIRESIRPDTEWEQNIGKTAEKGEHYAMILIQDLKEEINRINKINLPDLQNASKKDRQMHIDVYLGAEVRQKEALKKTQVYWDTFLPILKEIHKSVKKIGKTERTDIESWIFSETARIVKNMSRKMSEKRSETIISVFKDIAKITSYMPHGQLRSEVRDMTVDAVVKAERAFAYEELKKILHNNRINMYTNMSHVRKEKVLTAADFLDIFNPANKVFIRASTYGEDKRDYDGQIKIYCCRYNIDMIPYDKVKTVIYDGTASLDPAYDNQDIFQVVSYGKPRTHVKIIQMDEKSNRSFIQENPECHAKIARNMRKYFAQKIDHGEFTPEDIMISGYKNCKKVPIEEGLAWPVDYEPTGSELAKISAKPLATYGGPQITGSNDYRECSYLGKIGAHILPNATIFMCLCCRRQDIWQKLIAMEESNRAKTLQLIFTNNASWTGFKEEIDDCTLRTAMVAIVQEINRLRIRSWCERPEDAYKYGITVVWTWRGRKQGTYDPATEEFTEKLMRTVLEYFEVDCNNSDDYEYIPPAVCKRSVVVDSKKTMIARLEDWYDNLKPNSTFTMTDMASAIGITRKSLNSYLSRPEYNDFLLKIRGENDCYVTKMSGRKGYVYTKPADIVYEQQTLDLASM